MLLFFQQPNDMWTFYLGKNNPIDAHQITPDDYASIVNNIPKDLSDEELIRDLSQSRY